MSIRVLSGYRESQLDFTYLRFSPLKRLSKKKRSPHGTTLKTSKNYDTNSNPSYEFPKTPCRGTEVLFKTRDAKLCALSLRHKSFL